LFQVNENSSLRAFLKKLHENDFVHDLVDQAPGAGPLLRLPLRVEYHDPAALIPQQQELAHLLIVQRIRNSPPFRHTPSSTKIIRVNNYIFYMLYQAYVELSPAARELYNPPAPYSGLTGPWLAIKIICHYWYLFSE
jgi:hypothetical protein